MTATGKNMRTTYAVGICMYLLLTFNACRNQPSNPHTELRRWNYDSLSPDAFLRLKIKGGRTKSNGRKKNPALLLILKTM